MNGHVFLIGPGGVGKTSSGPYLAKLVEREFIDLDEIFMSRVGHIGQYIEKFGYAQYVRENSPVARLLMRTALTSSKNAAST